ncbi:MAG TPA: ATP-binding protein [Vicinamibacterales bacterium]|nr:ATP-binding protein [Vicinamibacterales bacterium]
MPRRKRLRTLPAEKAAELITLNGQLGLVARHWRATADAIDDALVLIDSSDKVMRMNRAAAASLGGSTWSVWVGKPAVRLAKYPPWDHALELGRASIARKKIVTGHAHDAENGRTWQLWARPLPDPEQTAVLLIARDVTAFLELQDSVRRAETMAALGELTAGVAHEVRNPLFAVSSLVEAWAQQPSRDPTPFVEALRREVTRLQTLMIELLEFGKPSSEPSQPGPLSTAVGGAVRACEPEAKARNVQLVTQIHADAEVAMFPRRLERVFVNLIQNAIQHSPAGGVVTIEISPSPETRTHALQVAVRDQGPGIAEADLPRLFTPFFSRRGGGFGLGLAISRRIIDEHRWRVTAANGPSGGAVMTVVVPLTDSLEIAPAIEKVEREW